MPSYTYQCQQCAMYHTHTVISSAKKAFTPACQACGGLTRQVIHVAPVVITSKHQPEEPETAPPQNNKPCCAMHLLQHEH